jgi:hypothetical protein
MNDIQLIIRHIRVWEVADKAYAEALDTVDEAIATATITSELIAVRDEKRTALIASVPDFVSRSTPDLVPSHHLLAALVALVNELEAVQRSNESLTKRLIGVYDDNPDVLARLVQEWEQADGD